MPSHTTGFSENLIWAGSSRRRRRREERSPFISMVLCTELSWLAVPLHVPAGQNDFINVYGVPYF